MQSGIFNYELASAGFIVGKTAGMLASVQMADVQFQCF
jgi:hypothetical protein